MSEQAHDREALVAEFCDEALELLSGLPERLVPPGAAIADGPAIDLAFRAIHTVKGNAGFFGLPVIKGFAHSLEDMLDQIRGGHVVVDPTISRCLVEAVDTLSDMVIEVQSGGADAASDPQQSALLERLKKSCEAAGVESVENRLLAELEKIAEEMASCQVPEALEWARRLHQLTEEANAPEPTDAENAVAGDGVIAASVLAGDRFRCGGEDVTERVQPLVDFFVHLDQQTATREHGDAFLRSLSDWIDWASERNQAGLVEILGIAREDFSTVFHSPLDMDPFLLSVVWERLSPQLLNLRWKEPAPSSDSSTTNAPAPNEAAVPRSTPRSESQTKSEIDSSKDRLIRVREEHVDNFLEDVSSLFITSERLKDLEHRMADELQSDSLIDELRQINATLAGQSTALQRSVVELRKVPARNLFSKFPRVARTLATQLGKQLDVHLSGEEMEIDKSLVDDLDGPLMHMIRNVCDHGIDPPDERRARGVPETGNLWLECGLTKTHVVMKVRDDGRGIDPQRLREKMIDRKLMSREAAMQLSDAEAVELIFHPGFSTAAEVSEISGRGVGLDVVRTRIREHGGDVQVSSQVGAGTEFVLEIPIRRAVVAVDALLVRHGSAKFVVPFEHIREITRVKRNTLSTVQGQTVARVRNDTFAAVSLEDLIHIPGTTRRDAEHLEGVLINGDPQNALLLVVDAVLGQRKVVVNDLPPLVSGGNLLGGVAQLGAGELALVINARDLARSIARSPRNKSRSVAKLKENSNPLRALPS